MSNADMRPWNDGGSDQEKIENDTWVPCRICERIFHRVTLTDRYCGDCGNGFCEGNHGTFALGRGKGVRCDGRLSN